VMKKIKICVVFLKGIQYNRHDMYLER